ncbi:MAG: class I SAM-dependent methyltransferase [Chromatiales bacterium]|nr:class I SAM-dependent methyltransferase [Chromatiales bacterium]
MSTSFSDHFSSVAGGYASHRPGYPAALFEWLAGLAPARGRAWDCATGSGQAARMLAEHFGHVVATDASTAQLAAAGAHSRVTYHGALAEASGLAPGSVDLVTVAQALHWFDPERFHAEVARVLAPGGVLAVWTYGLHRFGEPGIDAVMYDFYEGVLGPYWPPERRFVESGYRDLPFPWREIEAPPFAMTVDWSLPQLMGYLRTWSARNRYLEAHGEDPVDALEREMEKLWGDGPRRVEWPLVLRVGR